MVMNAAIEKEIESVRKLKTRALKARDRELFGEESPSSNQLHLFRRIAWRLQAEAEGQLSERARQRAGELARHGLFGMRWAPTRSPPKGLPAGIPGCPHPARC
jgi:Protein of unknown function (DUF2924)